jgi:hypothetical protein
MRLAKRKRSEAEGVSGVWTLTPERSHMKLTLALVAVGIVGVVSGCHSQAIDAHAKQEVAAIRADADASVMLGTCENGAAIGPQCGLLTTRVGMPDFQASFREKKCVGESAEVCDQKLSLAFEAWLEQRYWRADVKSVDITCNATAGRCDEPKEREIMLLESHNQAIRDFAAGQENRVEDERLALHRADHAPSETDVLIGANLAAAAASPQYHYQYRWYRGRPY